MRSFIITLIFISVVGVLFALPLTINSFISDSPLYKEEKQEIIDHEYTNEENADFGQIKSVQKVEKVPYYGQIEHIFTHCLIAYPKLAFDNSNPMAYNYARDCITSTEFLNLLNELYKNNYALININMLFINKNGKIEKCKIYVPKGKKPLVMSFDDVVYDHRKMKNGMVDKIAINANGKIVSETFENWQNGSGKLVQSYTSEFISILDKFVEKYPDFSIDGAKGTICLTGFDGVLGYRTSSNNTENRESEIEKAKKVVQKLKNNGWTFACHSYGHYHMNKITDEKFKEEIALWQSEVEPIIGKTKIYVYPYGEWQLNNNDNSFTNKHQMLINAGFELYCGVGSKQFFGYLPLNQTANKTLFMDRIPIDGYSLENNQKYLSRIFDADKVIDYKARKNST